MTARRAAITVLCSLLCLTSALAQEPAAPDRASTSGSTMPAPQETGPVSMPYRMIYVPDEALDRFDGVFLPMERDEFDRRITGIRRQQAIDGGGFAARIDQAVYSALLAGDSLVNGQAELTVQWDAIRPAVLPLSPFGLAIGQAEWDGPKRSSAPVNGGTPHDRAKIGLIESGETVLVVDRSGTVRFPWTLKGIREATGELRFPLALPVCPVTRLLLDLPRDVTPLLDSGVATPLTDGAESVMAEVADLQRWSIELTGGKPTEELKIVERDQSAPPRTVLVRDSTLHVLTAAGVETKVDLRLDVRNGKLEELRLSVGDGLRLVDAILDGERLAWTTTELSSQPEVLLELPRPLLGSGHLLQLRLLAAPPEGDRWELSGVTVHDARWQDGYITIEATEPLVVHSVVTENCRQFKGGSLAAPRKGESLQFQCFQPNARLEAFVGRRRGATTVRVGTTHKLTRTAINAVVKAEITSQREMTFLLDLDAAPDWTVDKVESDPPGLLDDWKLVASSARAVQYQISLKQAIPEDRAFHLTISANRRRWNETASRLSGRNLRVVSFPHLATVTELIAVGAESPYQVVLSNDVELDRVPPEAMLPEEASLVDVPPGGVVYRDAPTADRLGVTLSSDPPRFSADINAQASVDGGKLLQSYEFVCDPQASSVASLLVHFSRPLGPRTIWTFDGGDPAALEAVALSEQDRDQAGLLEGEAWRVDFPTAQGTRFRLTAQASAEFSDTASIPLASIIGAATQTAALTVHSLDGSNLDVRADGLQVVPPEPTPADGYTTTRLALRYVPSEEASVVVSRVTASDQPPHVNGWSCRLISRLASDGTGLHWAVYQLENLGARQVSLSSPPGAEIAEIRVDDQPLTVPLDAGASHVPITLPRGKRLVTLAVGYTTHSGPLAPLSAVTVPWPGLDLPVVHRTWEVWLPPGFETLDKVDPQTAAEHWRTRLFGPLARPAGILPFNPLRRESWPGWKGKAGQAEWAAAPGQDLPVVSPGERGAIAAWAMPVSPVGEELQTTLWTHRQIAISPSEPGERSVGNQTRIVIRQVAFMQAVSWGGFLIAVGAVWWLLQRRSSLVLALVALAGLLALAVPSSVAILFTSVFLGTLLAWTTYVLYRRWLPLPPPAPAVPDAAAPGNSDSPLASTATLTAIAVGLLLSPAGQTRGQETPPPAAAPGVSPIFSVLSPIDEQQRPEGEYVYVAEPLYEALIRQAESGRTSLQQWMIRSADYRAAFFWNVTPRALEVTDLRVTYEIEVFRPNVRLRLPVRQDQATLAPDSVRLDGQLVSGQPSPDGTGLNVQIDKPGAYNLELTLRPRIGGTGEMAGFGISVPPVADSRLRLALPPEAEGVEVAGAVGTTTLNTQTGETQRQLGPTSQLSVVWPRRNSTDQPTSEIAAEQLMWLDVQPQWSLLHTRFRFNTDSGRLRRIRLYPDPRLTLLSSEGGQLAPETRQADGSLVLRHDFDASVRGSAGFDATFLIDHRNGQIDLKTPLIEVDADRVDRRWLAVTLGEGMVCAAPTVTGDRDVTPAEFAQIWKPTEATVPQWAVRISPLDPPLTLPIRRRDLQLVAAQTLSVSFDPLAADFTLDADIDVSDGPTFQYAVDLSQPLVVNRVSVTQGSVERAASWSRDATGKLFVRLNGPVTGPNRLRIEATHPNLRPRSLTLPHIALADAEIKSYQVRLYRQPQVRIESLDAQSYVELADPAIGRLQRELGRLTHVLEAKPGQQAAGNIKLQLAANRPQVSGTLIVALDRPEPSWRATMHHRVTIEDEKALLDVLRYEIPAGWKEPFEVDGPADLEVVEVPGANRRRLDIRPTLAASREFEVRVTGNLSAVSRERIQTPVIDPLGDLRTERFLLLPTRMDDRVVSWDTRGLSRVTALPGYESGDYADCVAYHAIQAEARAVIDDAPQAVGRAFVRMAEYELECNADGSVVGTASFDLSPAGLEHCDLILPPAHRLIAVWLGGVPAFIERVDQHRWRVPLERRRMPLRLLVLFTAGPRAADQPPTRFAVQAPRLKDLAADQVLWTLHRSSQLALLPSRQRPIDQHAHCLLRLENLLEQMQDAVTVTSNNDQRDVVRWFQQWVPYWYWDRRRLEDLPPGRSLSGEQAAALLELDDQFRKVSDRLQPADNAGLPGEPLQFTVRPYDVWQTRDVADREPTDYLVETNGETGPATEISLERAQPPLAPGLSGRFAAMVIGGLVFAGLLWLSRRAIGRSLIRSPAAVCGAVCLVWWLWLTPSWFGLAILLVGLFFLTAGRLQRLRWQKWSA